MSSTSLPQSLRRLVNELTKLPSIGEKSALRLANFLLAQDERTTFGLAQAIREAREKILTCEQCHAFTEERLCPICQDPNRVQSIICVVEKPADVFAIEKTAGFRGVYHVLHGLWSPLRGVSTENLRIDALVKRISRLREQSISVDEVVLATSTTVEGDATALYLARVLQDLGVRTTRIAQGLPKGGELEYADDITLHHALQGRK